MEMKPVVSSHVHSVGYDAESETLHVRFHDGSVYEYVGVPKEKAEGLAKSPSVGKFLHQHIKHHHKGKAL